MNIVKDELRKKVLFCRRLLSPNEIKERSERITELFFSLTFWDVYENFFVYMSDGQGEVETKSLIYSLLKRGKKIWIPRVKQYNLIWYLIDEKKLQELKISPWGILEPLPDWEPSTDRIKEKTVCIVPGIVFDRRGYRIGHGKGFYDRFLGSNRRCISVGFCYSFQMVMLCPHRNWDVPVDWVITENNVFHPHNSFS
ncbi:MAG TPA: 5-formyltetrahydrofolate cyclo-ligase [Candidatus Hydrogenedens sp.]|nr:5-formyltetrahydrofolate cyclo-ligase [Candidatus Hydrogenedens sp.]